MLKIRFLQCLAGATVFNAGDTAEWENEPEATRLVQFGIAEFIGDSTPPPENPAATDEDTSEDTTVDAQQAGDPAAPRKRGRPRKVVLPADVPSAPVPEPAAPAVVEPAPVIEPPAPTA